MKLALDVGYHGLKARMGKNGGGYADAIKYQSPSIVGSMNASRFAMGEQSDEVITVNGKTWYFGETAVRLSRFPSKPEDRSWYTSEEYKVLVASVMAQATTATSASFDLATGLPLSYFGDRFAWRDTIAGEYVVRLGDRDTQTLTILSEPLVVGQPFGSLLSVALDDKGILVDERFLGKTAVIDIGAGTTDVLACDGSNGMKEVSKNSKSIDIGCWDMVRAMSEYLDERCPDRTLEPHEVATAIVERLIYYGSEPVDLSEQVDTFAAEMAKTVISMATQYLGAAKNYRAILITGGGVLLLGDAIKAHYPGAEMVPDPIFGNVNGYAKLLERGTG